MSARVRYQVEGQAGGFGQYDLMPHVSVLVLVLQTCWLHQFARRSL